MTPSITQEQAYTALRTFLLAVAASSTEVIQGQVNRVPMPQGPNWIVMQAIRREQTSTTARDYDPTGGKQVMGLPTTLRFQLDVYGPTAAENAQAIVTTFRSLWGADQFATSHLAPLYCDDPVQMPLLAGEQQWIQRWMIGCSLHGNISLSVDQQFADSIITGLTEITHGI